MLGMMIAISLLPALPLLLVPSAWVRATAGWTLLAIGVLYLDYHVASGVAPYDDDGFGYFFGILFVAAWSLVAAVCLLIRHDALMFEPEEPPRLGILQWAQSAAVPIAVLLAIFFHHWLSNRLAGLAPALMVHAGVAASALGLLLAAAWFGSWSLRDLSWRNRLVLVFSAVMILVVVRDSAHGLALWSRAASQAAGRPYCLMTYGGFEHRREARNPLDLSPLVNRHYGDWAAKKAPVLVIRTPEALESHRWFGGWQKVGNERGTCRPDPG